MFDFSHHKTKYIFSSFSVFFLSITVTSLFWLVLLSKHKNELHSNYPDYSSFYKPLAQNIANGKGYTLEKEKSLLRYPPGYPLLLAGIIKFSKIMRINENVCISAFILICAGITSLIIFKLAGSLWGPVPSFICAALWSSYPLFLWLTKQPTSEIPFIIFLYGSLFLFWINVQKNKQNLPVYFFIGSLLGFSMLIRPIAIGLSFILCLLLLILKPKIKTRLKLSIIALILLGNAFVVFPWEYWAHQKTGKIVLLSSVGPYALRDGITFAVNLKGYRKGTKVPADVEKFMRNLLNSDYRKLNTTKKFFIYLVKSIEEQPVTITKLYLIKAVRSWYGTDSQRYEDILLILQIPYICISFMAAYFGFKLQNQSRKFTIFVLVIVLYFWIMNILSTTLVRYMVPVFGLLFLLWPFLLKEEIISNKQHTQETEK